MNVFFCASFLFSFFLGGEGVQISSSAWSLLYTKRLVNLCANSTLLKVCFRQENFLLGSLEWLR